MKERLNYSCTACWCRYR